MANHLRDLTNREIDIWDRAGVLRLHRNALKSIITLEESERRALDAYHNTCEGILDLMGRIDSIYRDAGFYYAGFRRINKPLSGKSQTQVDELEEQLKSKISDAEAAERTAEEILRREGKQIENLR